MLHDSLKCPEAKFNLNVALILSASGELWKLMLKGLAAERAGAADAAQAEGKTKQHHNAQVSD